jgi:hypothetical protein
MFLAINTAAMNPIKKDIIAHQKGCNTMNAFLPIMNITFLIFFFI